MRLPRTVLLAVLLARAAPGTDTAFWHEYSPDSHDADSTYLLLQFNEHPLQAQAGVFSNFSLLGNAALADGGRYGRALALDGSSCVRCDSDEIFPGGWLLIEAWIKLEQYPAGEGCVVFRPAVVDGSAVYDPAVDRTKGFALIVDAAGALHLETVNTYYGRRTRTSSPPGAVPLGAWVHVAGISATFPISARRVYVNGEDVAFAPISWGEGLIVSSEEELESTPVYLGNNAAGDAGLTGLIDQLRIHRNIPKLWASEDDSWKDPGRTRPVPIGPPYFVAAHTPALYLPLDGNTTPASNTIAGLTVAVQNGQYEDAVRGQGYAGRIDLTAPDLFTAAEGSLEFWLRPVGKNNYSDRNVGFVNAPFVVYIFNGGNGPRSYTLYFYHADGIHFVNSAAGDLHPGRSLHTVITWRDTTIVVYVDGVETKRTLDRALAPNDQPVHDTIGFNRYGTVGLIDEIHYYPHALLPEEVANAYWRYRDPANLSTNVNMPSLDMQFEYLPSERNLYYTLSANIATARIEAVRFDLRGEGSDTVLESWTRGWNTNGLLHGVAPTGGVHTLTPVALTADAGERAGRPVFLYARPLAWEGNALGLTDEVFAPFTPVEVASPVVSVVLREMTVNGFGLWDKVVTLGRDILAEPMRVRFETGAGEGAWDSQAVSLASHAPRAAVFETEARAGPVCLTGTATVEFDGCMKVELDMAPGSAPQEIRRLWIEIPFKDAEARLLHAIADGLRHNYSGATPAGTGRVWDGSAAWRSDDWRNMFVPYIWLGWAERGLAFFAENDNGWITEKDRSLTPTHELVREGDRLLLRAHLINRPATLAGTRRIVFGLQPSPTKPMPANWRALLPTRQGGLAVVPWGGLQCPSQGPYGDDWAIVEKIREARYGAPYDSAWMEAYAAANDVPLVHGTTDWAWLQAHFAGVASGRGPHGVVAIYQEEMAASTARPDWLVYQDEWKNTDGPQDRTRHDGLDLRGGHRTLGGGARPTFGRSYADFGCWFANEWLSRGIGLYWDNTYLRVCHNTRTTAAYRCEDGRIQPCLTIWNQRAYHLRVWNLLQLWRRLRSEPLEWTNHMTNTQILPIHTFGTTDLDHELGVSRPFPPDWLLTETTGRQIGCYGLSLYAVAGKNNEIVAALPAEQATRLEWGLRAVHEIQRSGPLETLLTDFGLADPAVLVHNYWEDEPVLAVSPEEVKWLALADPRRRELLLVLASWLETPVTASVRVLPERAGTGAVRAGRVVDAETGEPVAAAAARPFSVEIPGPWGNRLLRVELSGTAGGSIVRME